MTAGAARERTAAFNAFSWVSDDLRLDQAADFAARIKDLGYGVKTCLQLIEISEMDREDCLDEDPPREGEAPGVPLMNRFDTANLMRLAITVSELIGEQAGSFLSKLDDRSVRAATVTQSASAKEDNHGEV
jgi:hypothetical protein